MAGWAAPLALRQPFATAASQVSVLYRVQKFWRLPNLLDHDYCSFVWSVSSYIYYLLSGKRFVAPSICTTTWCGIVPSRNVSSGLQFFVSSLTIYLLNFCRNILLFGFWIINITTCITIHMKCSVKRNTGLSASRFGSHRRFVLINLVIKTFDCTK